MFLACFTNSATNSSKMERWMNTLVPLEQTSPWDRKLAIRAPFTAFFMSASSKMISGDLPPSSRVTFLIPLAPASMILVPVGTLPVKESLSRPW